MGTVTDTLSTSMPLCPLWLRAGVIALFNAGRLWFGRKKATLVFMPIDWTNPFAQFLADAHSAFRKIPQQPEVHTDASLLPSFVQISEQRRFVFDIVDRVETLATAFDRLRALCKMHVDTQGKVDKTIAEQRDRDLERGRFEVPDELFKERNQCEKEARVLVAFAYYEMSTVVALLGAKFKPQPNSNLAYLIGVRHKILTHPRRNGFVKNSSSAMTIGPILHVH